MTDVILDIEADSLLPGLSNIWVAVVKPHDLDARIFLNPTELTNWIREHKPERIIGHNILGFDLPALHRAWGIPYLVNFLGEDNFAGERTQFVDTLQLSQFLWPDRTWGHSLEDWGNRLGFEKFSFNDWSKLSDEMIEYCVRDCEVTERVFQFLELEAEDRCREE